MNKNIWAYSYFENGNEVYICETQDAWNVVVNRKTDKVYKKVPSFPCISESNENDAWKHYESIERKMEILETKWKVKNGE